MRPWRCSRAMMCSRTASNSICTPPLPLLVIGVGSGLLRGQRNDHIKPVLLPHNARDVALTSEILRQQHAPRADPLDGPIPYFDFGFASQRDGILPPGGAVPIQDVSRRRDAKGDPLHML